MQDSRFTTSLAISGLVLLGWLATGGITSKDPPVGIWSILGWQLGSGAVEPISENVRSIMRLNLMGIALLPLLVHWLRRGRTGSREVFRWGAFGLLSGALYEASWTTLVPVIDASLACGGTLLAGREDTLLAAHSDKLVTLLVDMEGPETWSPALAVEACVFAYLAVFTFRGARLIERHLFRPA